MLGPTRLLKLFEIEIKHGNTEYLNEEGDIVIPSEILGDEIQNLVDIDNNIDCYGELTDQAIIEESTHTPDEEIAEKSGDDVPETCTKPSMREALQSIYVLKTFLRKIRKHCLLNCCTIIYVLQLIKIIK